MRIAIDAMGGDHAPAEIVKGARQALAANPELELALVGDEAAILNCWPEAKDTERVWIEPAGEVIGMNEHRDLAAPPPEDTVSIWSTAARSAPPPGSPLWRHTPPVPPGPGAPDRRPGAGHFRPAGG